MILHDIKFITLHCSDSDIESHDNFMVIRKWHLDRGFREVGYNYVITKNGDLFVGRIEGETLAHCKGHNKHHIAICLTGRHIFSEKQMNRLYDLVKMICERHKIEKIFYHNELDQNKTCPNFKVDWKNNFIKL